MPRTEIPLSKTNMFFSFSASLLFIIMGIYLLITSPDTQTTWTPYAIKGLGVVVILFFGLMALVVGRKLLDTTPAIIIDENGITDNTTTASVGFVAWNDIADMHIHNKKPKELLVIELKNPDAYIEKQGEIKSKMDSAEYGNYRFTCSDIFKYNSIQFFHA